LQSEAFDVFISYARMDWRHAAEIDSLLRARGLTSFFDRRNLSPGLPWIRELEKALNAAKAAIILIGPHGLGNTQQYERDLAIVRQTGDQLFAIVPVILPHARIDRPFSFLNILTWIDFSRVAKVADAPTELEHLVAAIKGERTSSADFAEEPICPYRGLDAFREEDAAFFFGRGGADSPHSPIGQLAGKVRDYPFVMVVGRSGSGKSSLVYAGLLPALRRARERFWNVLTLRPGAEPLRALAAAFNPRAEGVGAAEYAARIGREAEQLRSGGPELLSHMIHEELDRTEGKPDRLLLYIDQWEELYAQAPSPSVDKDQAARHTADVNRFIDLLLNASQSAPVSVVATLRADFYDPLISHQRIRALLPMQQVLLGAMSRAELESTIVEPAKMVGLTFDPPQIVSRILDDAGDDEGMLPLLQYALKETWALREGKVITGDSYARSGGVREAIRLTAERTFDELSRDDQQAARKLFLRLVTPGEGQEDTRARAAMPDEPTLRKIVTQFASPRTRLLVTGSDRADRPTVEVAHEALIRTWPRLRKWVDANREKLRARAAILQAKADWEGNSRSNDLLLPRGLQLERARTLLADPGDITVDDIKEFIVRSSQHAARLQRVARRFRWAAFAVLTTVVGAILYLQWDKARQIAAKELELQQSVLKFQMQNGETAARFIDQFLEEIERQISWVTRASVNTLDQRRADYTQTLQRTPAVDELVMLDGQGREQLRVSRFDVAVNRGSDYSHEPWFVHAIAQGSWWSPINFRGDQPYVTFAMAHPGRNAGVTAAELNLRFLSNFLNGYDRSIHAYVVGPSGRLLASSDAGLRSGTDLSGLSQVAAMATNGTKRPIGEDLSGRRVLVGAAAVPSVNLFVFFEQPLSSPSGPFKDHQ
jgi:TIR domain